ncbi:DNA repair endonuclease XPF-like [Orbicella faveolata]|uniref:DNA repair endonuclease XPF-like n=1 Tax=Orbicella faveolata TaxID=48498 RepID=UPI0009E38A97|nr:DNA repair endonuclease XPF-like [Orbicella faveolata]
MRSAVIFAKTLFKMAALSEYENAMFLELMDDDGLFVTAKGLSIERVVTNFLKIHCVTSDPSSISLILVINTTDKEESGFLFRTIYLMN